YVRVIDGELTKGQKIRFMGTDKLYQVTELAKLVPQPKQVERIGPGEVGYIVAAIKDLHDVRIGDTVTDAQRPAPGALPGYKRIDSPSQLPNPTLVSEIREPYIRMDLILPSESVGALMKLCEDRRGLYKKTEYIGATRVMLQYELPLAEVIYDFYDRLKSATRGYGTMDFDLIGFRPGNLVRMDILVNGDRVDALSVIVHRDHSEARGRKLLVRLKEEIARHLFEIPLQAAIGGKIIARETIKSVGKNVTAKCYGGDVTRKRKLLEKQKEGKKRMKRVGSVDIPQEAFMAILETED